MRKVLKKVYYGKPVYPEQITRGPCDEGYHIPTRQERLDLYNIGINIGAWTIPGQFANMLMLPPAGYFVSVDMVFGGADTLGAYMTCTPGADGKIYAYGFNYQDGTTVLDTQVYKTNGLVIRPFKNEGSEPIFSSGGGGASGSAIKGLGGGGGGDTDTNRTTLYGDSNTKIGVFYSQPSGLITISEDGINFVTIKDRNLGASSSWTPSSSVLSSTRGNVYQFGNNHGWSNPATDVVVYPYTTDKVDISSYGYRGYNSDLYVSNTFDRATTDSNRLWIPSTSPQFTEIKKIFIGQNKLVYTNRPYQRVECIRNDGTAYINTGIVNSTITKITMKINNIVQGSSYADQYSYVVFGPDTSSWWLSSTYYVYNGARFRYHKGDGTRQYDDCNAVQSNLMHNIVYNPSNFSVDGTTGTNIGTDSGWADASSSHLCLRYCGNNSHSAYDLYECTIETTEGTHHLIPCYRLTDGAAGLRDDLTEEFLTKSGGGALYRGLNIINYDYSSNNNTLAYYKFQSDFNELNGNNISTVNTCDTTLGMVNVTGANSYMTPTTAFSNSDITVSLWYKPSSINSNSWNTLFARNGGTYHHCLINGGSESTAYHHIGFWNNSWYPSTKEIEANKRYHIVMTKNGTNEKIYIDKELVLDSNSSFNNSTYPIQIFANYTTSSGNQPALGSRRELIIEQGNWQQNKITEYYNKTVGKFYDINYIPGSDGHQIPDRTFEYDFRGGSLQGFIDAGGDGIDTNGSYSITANGLQQTNGSTDRRECAWVELPDMTNAKTITITSLAYYIAGSWSNNKRVFIAYNRNFADRQDGIEGDIAFNTSSPGTYNSRGLFGFGENLSFVREAAATGETTMTLSIDLVSKNVIFENSGANTRTFTYTMTDEQLNRLLQCRRAGFEKERGYSDYNGEALKTVGITVTY